MTNEREKSEVDMCTPAFFFLVNTWPAEYVGFDDESKDRKKKVSLITFAHEAQERRRRK